MRKIVEKLRSSFSLQGLTVAPGSSVVSVKMPTAQKTQTGMVAGGVTPVEPPVTAGAPPASAPTASRVTVLSQVGACGVWVVVPCDAKPGMSH